MSLIPFTPLYLARSRSLDRYPHGFTGHVAHPIRSILSDEFLAEVRGVKYKNVAAELLHAHQAHSLVFVKTITYCLYREDRFYVAQCLNVDVSSFGDTREEALKALREAVELYFEDAPAEDFSFIEDAEVGQELVHA
jgi:predicted RNase H-like HicB family nuclease